MGSEGLKALYSFGLTKNSFVPKIDTGVLNLISDSVDAIDTKSRFRRCSVPTYVVNYCVSVPVGGFVLSVMEITWFRSDTTYSVWIE